MATTEHPSPSSPRRGSPDIDDFGPGAAGYSVTGVLGMGDEELDRCMAGPQRDAILGLFFGELSAEERNQLVQKLR